MKQSLIITSIDTFGNKTQKTFTDINPEVSNSILAAFGQTAINLTTNSYVGTDRIIKLNTDTDEDLSGGATTTVTVVKPSPTFTLGAWSKNDSVYSAAITYNGDGTLSADTGSINNGTLNVNDVDGTFSGNITASEGAAYAPAVVNFNYCTEFVTVTPTVPAAEQYLDIRLALPATSLEKLCGHVWASNGNLTIQDGKLYFDGNGSYLSLNNGVKLGGQDFTIRGRFNMSSNGNGYARVFQIHQLNGTNAQSIALFKQGSADTLNFAFFGDESNTFDFSPNTEYDFEVDYIHSTGTASFYLNGVLKKSVVHQFSELDYDACWIGRSRFSQDSYFNGSISEFEIYNGIALHTGEFTLD